ncbi:hypothetical protein TUA1478L_27170 [Lactiplantibacillus plantarum]
MTTLDDERATALAKQVNQLNEKRQGLVKTISASAIEQAQTPENEARQTLVITGMVGTRVFWESSRATWSKRLANQP